MPDLSPIEPFLQRWAASGAAERANYQLFLSELCDVIGVERPQPSTPDERANGYVFEKPVPLPYGSTGRIDLYKRGCFVLEAKQGSGDWEQARPLSTAAVQARRARWGGWAVERLQGGWCDGGEGGAGGWSPAAACQKVSAKVREAAAVRGVLQAAGGPLTAGQVAAAFAGAERARVEDLLAALGQVRGEGEGYVV